MNPSSPQQVIADKGREGIERRARYEDVHAREAWVRWLFYRDLL